MGPGQGVLDDWSIGFSANDTIVFAKQYHDTMSSHQGRPFLQQPRDLRAHVWPPSKGLLTKPCTLGVDSLFSGIARSSSRLRKHELI